MAVPFKKVLRKKPGDPKDNGRYYPQLVTLGQSANLDSIAYTMKEMSSLSLGDIQSVLTNFVEAMRTALYSGQSVNIKDFGVFSLGARTLGAATEKECTAKNIKAVKINFRASTSVKPSLTATRAGERIEFLDVMNALDAAAAPDEDGPAGDNGGGDNGGGDDGNGDEEWNDPST